MSIRISFFTFVLDDRRDHSLKLYKCRLIGKFAFSNRVCENWNCLREHIVTSTSLNMFKNKLDRQLWENWGLNKFFLKLAAQSGHQGQWLTVNTGKLGDRKGIWPVKHLVQ